MTGNLAQSYEFHMIKLLLMRMPMLLLLHMLDLQDGKAHEDVIANAAAATTLVLAICRIPDQHDTDQVCQTVLHDVPMPSRSV